MDWEAAQDVTARFLSRTISAAAGGNAQAKRRLLGILQSRRLREGPRPRSTKISLQANRLGPWRRAKCAYFVLLGVAPPHRPPILRKNLRTGRSLGGSRSFVPVGSKGKTRSRR